MLTDRGAREIDLVAVAGDADQREIAGAAADIADEHDLPVEQQLAGAREVVGDPGVEGRGGFFDQGEARETGVIRGLDGELARFFVEGGGNGEDDVVIGERAEFIRSCPTLRGWSRGSGPRLRRERERVRLRPASQGRILAVRSTSAFDSQDFALCTRRVGTSAPCSRAHVPTGWPSSRKRKDGSVRRGSTRLGATSCGMSKMWMGGKLVSSASAGSIQARAELVVPRSMPTFTLVPSAWSVCVCFAIWYIMPLVAAVKAEFLFDQRIDYDDGGIVEMYVASSGRFRQ